jgi:tRNA(fMet)-specific endonuclease VapC
VSTDGYLLDTNIFIAYLNYDPHALEFFQQAARDRVRLYFSVITESEVFTGLREGDLPRADQLFKQSRCLLVNSPIARRAAYIRREQRRLHHRKIQTPDALIMATAIEHGCALVSRDADMRVVQNEYGVTLLVI